MTRCLGLFKDVRSGSVGIEPGDYRKVSVGILVLFFFILLECS